MVTKHNRYGAFRSKYIYRWSLVVRVVSSSLYLPEPLTVIDGTSKMSSVEILSLSDPLD